ncbi:DsbA family protein [Peribacillus frigoritolerans]|uniref:DsbA family protein n=1 Tax=Peribacillus frigoritolerans TaxID=450367 RepID=UPI00399D43C6
MKIPKNTLLNCRRGEVRVEKRKNSKSKRSPFKLLVIATLLIFAALTALFVINNSKDKDATYEKIPPIEGQPTLGKSDAPVTVVEFGDFKCPACKAWGESIYPQLVKDYVDTGQVKFSFVNVLFHGEESKLGSLAAEAVYKQNPDMYWEFHKALFKEQPRENHDALWITSEKINEVAATIPDIDVNKLQEDMKDQSVVEEVNTDDKLVQEFKVEKTPSIMINGTMLGDPFDYEKIKNLLDKELKGME